MTLEWSSLALSLFLGRWITTSLAIPAWGLASGLATPPLAASQKEKQPDSPVLQEHVPRRPHAKQTDCRQLRTNKTWEKELRANKTWEKECLNLSQTYKMQCETHAWLKQLSLSMVPLFNFHAPGGGPPSLRGARAAAVTDCSAAAKASSISGSKPLASRSIRC